MRRYVAYLTYVLCHKWYVFLAGCRLGIPWLAFLHDNSKFLLDELVPYARFFNDADGTKRAQAADRTDQETRDFQWAWLRHVGRNKHHPQHWVMIHSFRCDCSYTVWASAPRDDVLLKDDGIAQCLTCGAKRLLTYAHYTVAEMPEKYRREMLADWIGVGKALGTGGPLPWYTTRGHGLVMHPRTRSWIETALEYQRAQDD